MKGFWENLYGLARVADRYGARRGELGKMLRDLKEKIEYQGELWPLMVIGHGKGHTESFYLVSSCVETMRRTLIKGQ